MKKSLIALSLAALPVAAMADVTLYGQIKAGVEISKVKVGSGDQAERSKTATEIADFGSRIGFKGHEHLGSNLNAIWQVENKVSVAGGGEWAGRESFIGLEGGFGKFRAGKLNTQLKDMGTIDPWEYNNNALGLGVFTRTGDRVVSARYDSPVFAGFSANVQYTPRDNANPKDKYSHDEKSKEAYYGGLNYENAGFFAQYGTAFHKNAYQKADGKHKAGQVHRVEAGYDANNLFAGLGYQFAKGVDSEYSYIGALSNGATDVSDDDFNRLSPADQQAVNDAKARRLKTQELAATVAYRFGNVTPRLSYAHGFKAKDVNSGKKVDNTRYHQVVVGADYDFSKRTTAMVSAGWLKAGTGNDKIQNTAGLVGVRHKF
ncbi:porin [Neisseria zoodegmatis]|uniref:Porin n=1 Tax=Neisseria zoodegmatis TaxID=326523 RepID=A0A378WV56_9NEIS|nr:trimeric porin PorB [Neisseria zoodegmatis]SUA44334.1 porin [Neisseria zoodegmatis]